MSEFLDIALSFPTVAFTGLLGLVLVYWLSVMFGAVDLDAFDPGGALDGAEGVGGELDGAAEGAGEGAAEGADGSAEAGGPTGFAAVLHALRLRHAPLTVVVSFIAVFGWIASYFGSRYLAPLVPLGDALTGALVLLAALVVALPLTSLATRPLAKLFKTEPARSNRDLIGQVVTVKTGHVDARFGQASLDDGQAGLLLKIRCEDPDALARGDRALIVDWDEESGAFEVEPMEALTGERAAKKSRAPRA
ncbi:MAG: DUF1449 family protein [Sandaracinaceae bacterium]|nr:DUF1449 family protein [Sandaracinaceae bacterium]